METAEQLLGRACIAGGRQALTPYSLKYAPKSAWQSRSEGWVISEAFQQEAGNSDSLVLLLCFIPTYEKVLASKKKVGERNNHSKNCAASIGPLNALRGFSFMEMSKKKENKGTIHRIGYFRRRSALLRFLVVGRPVLSFFSHHDQRCGEVTEEHGQVEH